MNPSELKVTSAVEAPRRKVVRQKSAAWAAFFAERKVGDLIELKTVKEADLVGYHARQNGFLPVRRPRGDKWVVYLKSAIKSSDKTDSTEAQPKAPVPLDLNIESAREEPKMRPWKVEEVPVGALYRDKRLKISVIILGAIIRSKYPIQFLDYTNDFMLTGDGLDSALAYREHSTDGGKTWHPCGVMEGGAK